MADPAGRIIPLPIRSNFRDGLNTLEYFISTHGARKGLTDTALRTADAGYLTRRLVDVAQDVIINAHDCGTEQGVVIRRVDDVAGQDFASRIVGRVLAGRLADPDSGEVLLDKGDLIDIEESRRVAASGVTEVFVRSPLTCELQFGMCANCYGMDLGRGKMVNLGTAVGIVAASRSESRAPSSPCAPSTPVAWPQAGHHHRSAARRGAVRGPQEAEGRSRHCRDRRIRLHWAA